MLKNKKYNFITDNETFSFFLKEVKKYNEKDDCEFVFVVEMLDNIKKLTLIPTISSNNKSPVPMFTNEDALNLPSDFKYNTYKKNTYAFKASIKQLLNILKKEKDHYPDVEVEFNFSFKKVILTRYHKYAKIDIKIADFYDFVYKKD